MSITAFQKVARDVKRENTVVVERFLTTILSAIGDRSPEHYSIYYLLRGVGEKIWRMIDHSSI